MNMTMPLRDAKQRLPEVLQDTLRPSAKEQAGFISENLKELRKLADDQDLSLLRYLLSMALEEADKKLSVKAPGRGSRS
jgi:hypothetical protein